MTLTLIVSVMALSVALMRSDLEHRSEAAIDPLTGMLNRGSLETRVVELEAQARRTPQPVALLVGDIDHFKTINDEHGHAVGDSVLAEVAERFRGELRAYDLAYRHGGEEFVVLLPGAAEHESAELAESLRRCIALDPICGVAVTVSFGVSAWDGRGEFSFGDCSTAPTRRSTPPRTRAQPRRTRGRRRGVRVAAGRLDHLEDLLLEDVRLVDVHVLAVVQVVVVARDGAGDDDPERLRR